MRQYLIRRLFLIIPTMIGITLMTFALTRIVPGGPIEQALMEARFNQSADTLGRSTKGSREGLTEEDMQYLRELYGFDKPIMVAYWDWLKKVAVLDLGESYRYNEPVWDLIKERLPISIYYGVVTTILTYLISVPLGVLKAIRNKTWIDSATSVAVFTGYAVPSFVLGLILVVYMGGRLEWFPMQGFTSDDFDEFTLIEQIWDIIYHSILPLICYMIGGFASMTVLMKNSLLENLSADFIRTAFAKGLPPRIVVYRHALRNSLIPLAASFGNNISLVFMGAYLIEKVFNIDGLGLLGFQAVTERDYPVVMGTLFLSSLMFLVGNILSDICLAAVDPRIRFS
ncbi:MAG: peptide ABC transporter permease [SAR324 cluster bacterium]|uniref:Peptide ABC transporter permease n=1 Tax=SAR324 cluster bacterium TaxID=2024889 RepID=A0A2A4T474_9DELT|nr:MAG: peptide ABC transporter permease [SAR324 cluster bacterium]